MDNPFNIYDCFIFCNELVLLEIRLNELSPFVDKFVLIESTHTFSGKPKRLYYDEAKDTETFAPFKDKIIHVIFDEVPNANAWHNERAQRNILDKVLKEHKVQPNDLIIFSDVDELIDPDVFEVIKKTYIPATLLMPTYYYQFNCQHSEYWMNAAFCRYRHYFSADILRNAKFFPGGREYHKVAVLNAGWHFSYLMSAEEIVTKIMAFLHLPIVLQEYGNCSHEEMVEKIQACIDNHRDLYGRKHLVYSVRPLNAPKYVMNNMERYKDFIADLYWLSRSDVINEFIRKNKYRRYLEIGVGDKKNFARILCEYKAGIDPNIPCEYKMTSDDFFKSHNNGEKFDLIFIDGLHTAQQAKRDVDNALTLITENGLILLHDCNPMSEELQYPIEKLDSNQFPFPGWCGDVWKAYAELRMTRPDLSMYVIDVDFGIGVIKKGSQKVFPKKIRPDYAFLEENRQELLNIRKPKLGMIGV